MAYSLALGYFSSKIWIAPRRFWPSNRLARRLPEPSGTRQAPPRTAPSGFSWPGPELWPSGGRRAPPRRRARQRQYGHYGRDRSSHNRTSVLRWVNAMAKPASLLDENRPKASSGSQKGLTNGGVVVQHLVRPQGLPYTDSHSSRESTFTLASWLTASTRASWG